MPDFNEWNNVSRIFNGYFQIYDGNTPYKFMQMVEMQESIASSFAPHYGTTGTKKIAGTGHESRYSITIDNTADLYDETSNDTKSISYFADKILGNEPAEIEFEGVEKTDAATNRYIRSRFKGNVVEILLNRNRGSGTYERTIIIEVTDKIKLNRTGS